MPVLASNRCAHPSGGLIRGSLVYAHISFAPIRDRHCGRTLRRHETRPSFSTGHAAKDARQQADAGLRASTDNTPGRSPPRPGSSLTAIDMRALQN